MKTIIRFAFLLALGLGRLSADEPTKYIIYDQYDSSHYEPELKVEHVAGTPTPLFSNASFLQLKPGDKIVYASQKIPKSDSPWEGEYLVSGDRYYQLDEKKNGQIICSPLVHEGSSWVFYHWVFSMENAEALRKLLPQEYSESITTKQYTLISEKIRNQFPSLSTPYCIPKNPSRIELPGHQAAKFEGIAFDRYRDRIYKYTLLIGPDVFTILGETLIQGPPVVQRYEFEGVKESNSLNGPPPIEIDPATAKTKRAEFEEMTRFQNLMNSVLK